MIIRQHDEIEYAISAFTVPPVPASLSPTSLDAEVSMNLLIASCAVRYTYSRSLNGN